MLCLQVVRRLPSTWGDSNVLIWGFHLEVLKLEEPQITFESNAIQRPRAFLGHYQWGLGFRSASQLKWPIFGQTSCFQREWKILEPPNGILSFANLHSDFAPPTTPTGVVARLVCWDRKRDAFARLSFRARSLTGIGVCRSGSGP